jgi:hypothetical protein
MILVNVQGANLAFTRFQRVTPREIQEAYAAHVLAPSRPRAEMVAEVRACLNPNTRRLSIAAVTWTVAHDELANLQNHAVAQRSVRLRDGTHIILESAEV